MSVFYNFINNDTTVLGLPVRVKKKLREKRERRTLLPSHGVVDFTSRPRQHGVEFDVQVY